MVAISKAQDNFTLLHDMPISSPDQVIRTLIAEVADAKSIPSLDKQVSLANRLFKIECGKTTDRNGLGELRVSIPSELGNEISIRIRRLPIPKGFFLKNDYATATRTRSGIKTIKKAISVYHELVEKIHGQNYQPLLKNERSWSLEITTIEQNLPQKRTFWDWLSDFFSSPIKITVGSAGLSRNGPMPSYRPVYDSNGHASKQFYMG